ncbi:nucleoside-diphosphate sugar epimerase/dehydratase [Calditerrivibrio nitroreducens]|uniref:Polysaccharide biosynthesis protein CapD n=1 Tax=Calditerrivibrio nitroreducens (strain DSM 19672 / NBRC 101217 / Yu37-1) TaxID=768670 RepID=E4TIT4_CALNY|nr:nucleoside-diphosphate sugar epimerase/dehydratase [Calditerrivibrio nitroreducens]ADR18039.1 polysaccharide biosynthesis protein CapD [Calditerrivibrio nitroreducens DSM 19672]
MNVKKVVAVVLFISIAIFSIYVSYLLRFEFNIPDDFFNELVKHLPLIVFTKLLVFWYFNFFRGWWRFVSIYDALNIIRSSFISTFFIMVYLYLIYGFYKMPRSAFIIDLLLFTILIFILRVSPRLFKESYGKFLGEKVTKKRVLIVGAGSAGQMIAREIKDNDKLHAEVVGFVDDDERKIKTRILGIPVIGSTKEIPIIAKDDEIDEIVIAIPSASKEEMQRIVEKCREAAVGYKIIPGFGEILEGKLSVNRIRDVEIEDLLGRPPIKLKLAEIEQYLKDKVVLVTGAGGSIGGEIARQVSRYSPKNLIILDIAETPLFFIENYLKSSKNDLNLTTIIGDVKNIVKMEQLFKSYKPDIVIHAAAYKHVPMMELNPDEAIWNNIFGTKVIADLSCKYEVDKFILISTDKAVNPTNIMGATKRIAELYIKTFPDDLKTKFIIVRFGNVLGSNGSVIPIFKEQIKNGGPVTVTHPEVTRYFMTIPEAVQLVLQAGGIGKGGELFLLDMGEPVKILKLAEEMIRLSNFEPYKEIDIVFTGLRPGEKLYEELLLDEEGSTKTEYDKIWIAKQQPIDKDIVLNVINDLLEKSGSLNLSEIKDIMRRLIPTLK